MLFVIVYFGSADVSCLTLSWTLVVISSTPKTALASDINSKLTQSETKLITKY